MHIKTPLTSTQPQTTRSIPTHQLAHICSLSQSHPKHLNRPQNVVLTITTQDRNPLCLCPSTTTLPLPSHPPRKPDILLRPNWRRPKNINPRRRHGAGPNRTSTLLSCFFTFPSLPFLYSFLYCVQCQDLSPLSKENKRFSMGIRIYHELHR